MNTPTITMPKEEAIRAYREFRQACHGNPTDQDQAVMLGLKALANGHAVIDLVEAMRTAGLDEQGHPRLAIASAWWKMCHLYLTGDGRSVRFQLNRGWVNGRPPRKMGRPSSHYIEFPRIIFPATLKDRDASGRVVAAAVPYIPPSIRPENLESYHVLWEAVWKPIAPTDPMLLRHLGGSLYAVLAVWDLTPLERAVMGANLPEGR